MKQATKATSRTYLEPLNLSHYADIFDEQGYEDPSVLDDMSIDELMNELNMKRGHAKLLKRWLDGGGGGGGGGGAADTDANANDNGDVCAPPNPLKASPLR